MHNPLPAVKRVRKEPNTLQRIFHSSDTPQDYVLGLLNQYVGLLQSLDFETIATLIDRLEEACENGRQIFLMGNGGSGAVASHMAADMSVNGFVSNRRPFRAISLSDNVESISAIANDSGYENIFLFQLRSLLQPEDMVIALSVSGNSENVVRGVEYANEVNAYTVSMTGFDGGRLAALSRLSLHIPTTFDEYGPVEDLFSCVAHIVTGYLSMKRGRSLSHQ